VIYVPLPGLEALASKATVKGATPEEGVGVKEAWGRIALSDKASVEKLRILVKIRKMKNNPFHGKTIRYPSLIHRD
jgi:hypothetical protein